MTSQCQYTSNTRSRAMTLAMSNHVERNRGERGVSGSDNAQAIARDAERDSQNVCVWVFVCV